MSTESPPEPVVCPVDPESSEPIEVKPPPQATHWRAQMLFPEGETPERLVYPPKKGRATTWPIAEFSPDEVCDRWGEGTYLVHWCKEGEDKKAHIFDKAIFVLGVPSHLELEEDEEDDDDQEDARPSAPEPSATFASPPSPPFQTPVHAAAPAAPPPLPVMPAGAAGDAGSFQVVMAQALSLFNYFTELGRHARAEARTEAELAIRRHEIDVKASIERERMSNDRVLAQQQQFYQSTTQLVKKSPEAPQIDTREITRAVEDLLEDRIAELEEKIQKSGGDSSSVKEVMDGIKEMAPTLVPMLMKQAG